MARDRIDTHPRGPALAAAGWRSIATVAVLTLVGAAIHVFGYCDRPLWSDEASTYWTVQAGLGELLRGARTDGTPPLYFAMVRGVTRLCGASEISLRLASMIPAILLVPASYLFARRFLSERGAMIAAGLTAVSPLVHYYSVEARNYALVQLETVGLAWAAWQALSRPDNPRNWAIVALAHAVQLWTHNAAVFLLPVLPIVGLLVGGSRRASLAAKAAGASAVAFALYSPWLAVAEGHAAAGIADWIAPYWQHTPPAAAILRSFEVFGFGGLYPDYLSYLGTATPVRAVSLPLTLLALVLGLWVGRAGKGDGPERRNTAAILCGFLVLPLLGLWFFSLLVEPLYLVGRYDTIVLPIFLVVFAAGLDRAVSGWPIAGWTGVAAAGALALVTHATSLGQPVPDDPDVSAAGVLARSADTSDLVISTGLRRPVVEYYLERAHHPMEIRSYPEELGAHPGWQSQARMLTEPARLEQEAQALAGALASTGRSRTWLLSSGRNEVDAHLVAALADRFSLDPQSSDPRAGLLCLTPRGGRP